MIDRPTSPRPERTSRTRVVCFSFDIADYSRWKAWFANAANAAGVETYRAYPDNWDMKSVDAFFDEEASRCDDVARAILSHPGRAAAGIASATYVAALRTH